jgi:hypothetical protein
MGEFKGIHAKQVFQIKAYFCCSIDWRGWNLDGTERTTELVAPMAIKKGFKMRKLNFLWPCSEFLLPGPVPNQVTFFLKLIVLLAPSWLISRMLSAKRKLQEVKQE